VAKGLKVPCLFMITEVSIRCQKNPEVGIRRIPAYTPQYTTESILTRMHHHLLKTLYSFHARWSLLMLLKTKLRSAKWWFRHVHLKRFPVGEISFRITEGLRISLLYLRRSASSLPIVYVTVSFFLSCLCIAVFLRYCDLWLPAVL